MVKYRGPKNRIARALGGNIFRCARNPLANKPFPPGVHGHRHRKKSDFALGLIEKKKLSACFGMLPLHVLNKYYKKAIQKDGDSQTLLMRYLESRLDVVVYRMKFALSIFHAQQLVSHKHILVNGSRVNIRSFQVEPGMTVSLAKTPPANTFIKQSLESPHVKLPEYIEYIPESFKGSLLTYPEIEQIPLPMPINISMVCEFLAKR